VLKSVDTALDLGMVGLLRFSLCHFAPWPPARVSSTVQANTDCMWRN